MKLSFFLLAASLLIVAQAKASTPLALHDEDPNDDTEDTRSLTFVRKRTICRPSATNDYEFSTLRIPVADFQRGRDLSGPCQDRCSTLCPNGEYCKILGNGDAQCQSKCANAAPTCNTGEVCTCSCANPVRRSLTFRGGLRRRRPRRSNRGPNRAPNRGSRRPLFRGFPRVGRARKAKVCTKDGVTFKTTIVNAGAVARLTEDPNVYEGPCEANCDNLCTSGELCDVVNGQCTPRAFNECLGPPECPGFNACNCVCSGTGTAPGANVFNP